MRQYKKIKIANIVIDRYPLNPSILGLLEHLKSGGSVPPIHIQKIGNGQYKILDGRHRVTAFKLLGKKDILSRFAA